MRMPDLRAPYLTHRAQTSVVAFGVITSHPVVLCSTHCFHPATLNPDTGSSDGTSVVDNEKTGLVPAALAARERGIRFCLGHGQVREITNSSVSHPATEPPHLSH